MPIASIAAVSALLASFTALAQNTTVADSGCDCFLTNGTAPIYFKSHGFWDFRSFSQYIAVNPPGLKLSVEKSANADFTTPYLNYDAEFSAFWGGQAWVTTSDEDENNLLPNQNSLNSLYIEAEQRPPKRNLPSHTNRTPRQSPLSNPPPNSSPKSSSTTSPCHAHALNDSRHRRRLHLHLHLPQAT